MNVSVRSRLRFIIVSAVAVIALGGIAIFVPRSVAREQYAAGPRPVRSAQTTIVLSSQTAGIDEIDAHRSAAPALFRLREDPDIMVLDFPDLHPQAQMLNRVAALIEKANMPRDRVVTEAELDDHIRATGGNPDAYYYGHDYRAADLARFFQLADKENIALNPYETWLRTLLDEAGWLKDEAVGALISIPGVSPDVDASSRTTIFRHELSHGVYFTDPAYVALTRHWWNDLLTDQERGAMVAFLGKEGYDTNDEDLMANEGQAFFINTRDPRYFMPEMVGIGPARETALRGAFIDAIPEPWLRESARRVAPVAAPDDPPKVSDEPWSAQARPPLRAPRAGGGPPSLRPDHQ
jgi:hypothetical protein